MILDLARLLQILGHRNKCSFRLYAMNRKSNKLVNEKSPYLLQHCYNPVNWYPWRKEAFNKAKELNLPIFLSVGYSTCHWCHVMEKESFENERIAKLLNDNFVSIKVDREERPDIDKLYMSFIQKISGSSGWPMSVFLTPNLEPLTGGTYFPPCDTFGQIGFPTLLTTITEQWKEKQADLLKQAKVFSEELRNLTRAVSGNGDLPITSMTLDNCYRYFVKQFDEENGGIGIDPKFPKPVDQMFLLYYYKQNRTTKTGENALRIVAKTLEKMALGGIHDHIGKGFHRYTVDAAWKLPHFEKMLYDEGQLLELYASHCKISGRHLDVVHDIADYLIKNLSLPEGGFFSAEDADSLPYSDAEHKEEGAFYTWTKTEIEEVLYDHPARFNENITLDELACLAFNVMENGNIPLHFDIRNELTGKNVLRLIDDAAMEKCASEYHMSVDKLKVCLEDAKRFLAERRATRPPPHMDRKILTSWNALAISGFCAAATIAPSALSNTVSCGHTMTEEIAQAYRERASEALAFVGKHLTDPNSGDLLHSVYASEQDELVQLEPAIKAFSNDYAFLIQALLDMYETDFNEIRLRWALDLQNSMDKYFWDTENNSGYYLSHAGDSSILARMQDDQDLAEPCTNSVAASNLLRLAALFNSKDFAKRAEDILRGTAKLLEKIPHVLPRMMSALYLYDNAVPEITVVGSSNDKITRQMISEIQTKFIPKKYFVFIDIDKKIDSILLERNEHFAALASSDLKATTYICKNQVCEMPINSVDELKKRLCEL